jgi:hypothetical protein
MKSCASSLVSPFLKELNPSKEQYQDIDFKIATKVFGFHKKLGPRDIWCDWKRDEHQEIPKYSSDFKKTRELLLRLEDWNINYEIEYEKDFLPTQWVFRMKDRSFKSENIEKAICEAVLSLL